MRSTRSVSIVRWVALPGMLALVLAVGAVPAAASGSSTTTLTSAGTREQGLTVTFSWSHFKGRDLTASLQLAEVISGGPPVVQAFALPNGRGGSGWRSKDAWIGKRIRVRGDDVVLEKLGVCPFLHC